MRHPPAVSQFIKAECASGPVGKPWKLAMSGAGKMALWIKALTTKPKEPAKMVEAEN